MGNCMKKVYCGAHTIISSLGVNSQQNYDAVMSYTTNLSPYFNSSVALIDRDKLDLSGLDNYADAERLSISALSETIKQAGVSLNDSRSLLIISTTKGNIDCINDDFRRSYLWSMANQLEKHFECSNKPLIVSNACVSGVAAVVVAARLIECGEYDNVYVLGVDVVSRFVVSGFNSFKSLSASVCRPYDVNRDGLTLGEACSVLMLSADGSKSESKIVVSGGALSDDANHISGPSRTGDGLFYAINGAMTQAGVDASHIGFVNAHGTGTVFNDEMESKALNLASLTNVPCNSLKPYLGHTLGASGVVEIILSILQLQNNVVFGVKGYDNNGVPHELNVSGNHRNIEVNHCIKTASGFGGTNAAVVLSKAEYCNKDNVSSSVRVDYRELASFDIRNDGQTDFGTRIRDLYKSLGESNMKFFKMDNLSKLGYVASCLLLKDITLDMPAHRIGLIVSSRSSSLDTDINHQRILEQNLPEGTSPAVFVYTLANVVAAEIAIKHKFQGELNVFVSEEKNMDFMKEYSQKLIEDNVCDAVIYGWCELLGNEYEADFKLLTI